MHLYVRDSMCAFWKGCLASVIAEKIFRDAKQLSLSMSGMMLFRDISCKIPIFQTLGGWGGVPRSVNGLNIYTFDLDCMFATVLYFPWVLRCFPRFSFVLIPFLTYVIILSWVCTAHFASRAMFWFLTVRPKCCGTSRRSMDHDSGEKTI